MDTLFCKSLMGVLFFCAVAGAQPEPGPDGMWEQATLYRDPWGTPHVYAENPRALAFAFGYAQAEDHLEGMLRAYRVATGRAAAVYGKEYAASDEFALRMHHGQLAKRALRDAPPLTRDLCEGFALGVNVWMGEHPKRVPEWAEGVEPPDILALLHCYLMSFAPFDLPEVFHRPRPSDSANAWAIGPEQSATGEAMLVINPHTDYTGPFQWYEAHLVTPHTDIAGATIFGLPLLLQGHNETLGWALSPNEPDFADMYMDPAMDAESAEDPSLSELERRQMKALLYAQAVENSKPYYVRTNQGPRQRMVQCPMSEKGPIMGSFEGVPCAYHIGGYFDFGALEQLMVMSAARNLDEFQAALDMHQLPCFHVVYADRDGNIAYLYNAKFGSRYTPPSADDPTTPEDEDQSEEIEEQEQRRRFWQLLRGEESPDAPLEEVILDWTRPLAPGSPRRAWGPLIPVEALPAIVNPPSGYLQACGTPPWAVTEGLDMVPEDWPEWFARDRDTFRAQRVRELLGSGPRTFQDNQAMLFDVLAPYATRAVPRLLEIAEANPDFVGNAHPDLPTGLDILRGWNYVADANSVGMTLFDEWWRAFSAMAGPGERPGALHLDFLGPHPRLEDLALHAAEDAVRRMRNLHGSLNAPWGDVHVLRRGKTEVPLPGGLSGEPVFVAAASQEQEGRRDRLRPVQYGYGYAMTVQFGDTPTAVSLSPFGSSENPESPHYDDQLPLMEDRRFKVSHFLDRDVQRYAASAYGQAPTLRPKGMRGVFLLRADRPAELKMNSTAEAPGPLPEGMTAFTACASPQCPDETVGVTVDMAIHVPPGKCPRADLGKLSVYAYEKETGWHALSAQQLDANTRVFKARDRQTRTYAILGPVSIMAKVEQPEVDNKASAQGPTAPEAKPKETGETPKQAEPHELPAATKTPTQLTLPPPPEDTRDPRTPRSPFGWGEELYLVPEGVDGLVRFRAAEAMGAFLKTSKQAPGPLPAKLSAFTDFVKLSCSASDIAVKFQIALLPRGEGEDLALYAYDTATGWKRMPNQMTEKETGRLSAVDETPRTYAVLGVAPAGAQTPAAELPSPTPATSGKTKTAKAPPQKKSPAAPKPKAKADAGVPKKPNFGWGTDMELVPDGAQGVFQVKAKERVGAFLRVLTETPGALPQGMAAFTDFVLLKISKDEVEVSVSATLNVTPGACAAEALPKLKLYGYDAENGWTPLGSPQSNPNAGSCTGTDTRARTYAILGPTELRTR